RSYATRVLSHRVASFVERYPWIDLILDGHRYLCDLGRGEADVAIRVGDGKWSDALVEKIAIDPLFPVASPTLVHRMGTTDILALAKATSLLHFTERPYWDLWAKSTGLALPRTIRNVRFSETVMALEAAEAGQGVAMARRSLVDEAVREGSLVRL